MIAVTIGCGERYGPLAELTASRVRAMTGLETRILGIDAMRRWNVPKPHYLKMRLFREFPEADSILYFDADLIYLRRWDPRVFEGRKEIACVGDLPNSGLILQDADVTGVPIREYFNSGFFIVNREYHAEWLERSYLEIGAIRTGFHDQGYLNRKRWGMGIPALFLSKAWNYLEFDERSPVDEIVAGHSHAVTKMPRDVLEAYLEKLYVRAGDRAAPNPLEMAEWSAGQPGIWRDQRLGSDDGCVPSGLEAPGLRSGGSRFGSPSANDLCGLTVEPSTSPTRMNNDHVQPLTPEETLHRERLDAEAAQEFVYPAEQFRGRGIVIPAGGMKYFPCAWVCIKMLRRFGCTLPIEVWHLGPAEMDDEMRALLAPLGVKTVDARAVQRTHPVRILNGWELKAFALLHCAFGEVLLLDADNVPMVDPTFLFDTPEYRQAGAIFWPDYSRLPPERSIWRVTGVPYQDEAEFESGEMVIDKARCWKALHVTMHLNEHSDFYYRHIHGDKETFHMAWRKIGQEYAMPPFPVFSLERTMCQHDFQGRRIFQHRNFDKWRLDGRNSRVAGFAFEKECLEYVGELFEKHGWIPDGVQRWRPEGRSAEEIAAARELTLTRYHYSRVGHDWRPMTFGANGMVAEGAAGCEVFWNVRRSDGTFCLDVFSKSGRTFALIRGADGIWRGRWEVFEKMPIELIPRGSAAGTGGA